MAKIVINIDDDKTANAIALWFESGEALDEFEDSKAGEILVKAGGECPEGCDVEFDESSSNVYHVVNIN